MSENNNEVVFTYETLYEVLHREKNKEEPQELDEKFYQNALTYLKEKQHLYDETLKKDDLFSANERDALQTQIKNIRKLLKDFYSKREKKIVDMSLNAVKINKNIIDVSNLLIFEKELYEKITNMLENFRKNVLLNLLMLRQPSSEEIKTENLAGEKTIENEKRPKEKTEDLEGGKTEEMKEELKTDTQIKTVKFKEKVEQFVGKNLELYGPFSENKEAKLPAEIANILIKQEKAEEIESK